MACSMINEQCFATGVSFVASKCAQMVHLCDAAAAAGLFPTRDRQQERALLEHTHPLPVALPDTQWCRNKKQKGKHIVFEGARHVWIAASNETWLCRTHAPTPQPASSPFARLVCRGGGSSNTFRAVLGGTSKSNAWRLHSEGTSDCSARVLEAERLTLLWCWLMK